MSEQVLLPVIAKLEDFLKSRLKTRDGGDFFKIGFLKCLIDSSLRARPWSFLNRMRTIKITVALPYILRKNLQPIFVLSDLLIVEKRVGKQRAECAYNWKFLLERSVHVAAGSDSLVESFNQLCGIYAAVTRKNLAGIPRAGGFQIRSLPWNKWYTCSQWAPSTVLMRKISKDRLLRGNWPILQCF